MTDRFADLPPLLRDLARYQGDDAGAIRLVEMFGGRSIYVPSKPRPGQKLADALGLETARALTDLRGGETVDVPRRAYRPRISKEIAARSGPAGEIAKELGCTRSWVKKVRRRLRRRRRGAG